MTSIAVLGVGSMTGIAAVIGLIALLFTRELSNSRGSSQFARIARFASVGILPLSLTFCIIVALKVIEVL